MSTSSQGVDFDRPGLQVDRLAIPGDVVGPLAGDLDGGELRRHLLDGADVVAAAARGSRRRPAARRSCCVDAAFGIVGVALLAPAHGEAVALAPVHHERNRLGRFAERDRQHA